MAELAEVQYKVTDKFTQQGVARHSKARSFTNQTRSLSKCHT